jgi:hypothetical protein
VSFFESFVFLWQLPEESFNEELPKHARNFRVGRTFVFNSMELCGLMLSNVGMTSIISIGLHSIVFWN